MRFEDSAFGDLYRWRHILRNRESADRNHATHNDKRQTFRAYRMHRFAKTQEDRSHYTVLNLIHALRFDESDTCSNLRHNSGVIVAGWTHSILRSCYGARSPDDKITGSVDAR